MRCWTGCCKSVLWAQMLGDRNWLAAKIGSGAAVDKLKLHPHGAVRMPSIHYACLGGSLGRTTNPHQTLVCIKLSAEDCLFHIIIMHFTCSSCCPNGAASMVC